MSTPIGDPVALLGQAHAAWAASPAWTMTGTDPNGSRVIAAVRPGMDWIDMARGQVQVLLRDDTAYVRGALGPAMLLGGPGADRLGDDDGRWLAVPASRWLRRPMGNTAVSMFEDIGRADEVDGQSVAGFSAVIEYGDEPLDLPEPRTDGIRDLPPQSPQREGPGRGARRQRPVTIEVLPPEEPGEPWSLYSEDLPGAFGVEAGHDAEELALRLIAQRRPDLLPLVEADSYDVVFSAYVPDEATARAVADILLEAGA